MSGIIKVFLLLAVVACISKAQLNEAEQSCLCQRFRNGIDSKFDTKDIQFYPATNLCNRVEIVVTSGKGFRFCLNPQLPIVKKMITRFLRSKKTSPSKPTRVTITSSTCSYCLSPELLVEKKITYFLSNKASTSKPTGVIVTSSTSTTGTTSTTSSSSTAGTSSTTSTTGTTSTTSTTGTTSTSSTTSTAGTSSTTSTTGTTGTTSTSSTSSTTSTTGSWCLAE